MLLFLKEKLTGVLTLSLFTLNLIFIPSAVIIVGFAAYLLPFRWWRHSFDVSAQRLSVYWTAINNLIMKIAATKKWDIQGQGDLNPQHSYALICNHQSWVDILVLGYVFNFKTPFQKYFLKKELLWALPFAGLACKAVGYAFMERHTPQQIRKNPHLKDKDIQSAKKACQKFRETPSTIVNFVEGTRFSELKKERRQSPYQHLLSPKTGGLAIAINELQNYLTGIINVTVAYSPQAFSLWDFFCGKSNKISVRYEVLSISPELIGDYYHDRKYRQVLQSWLNQLWEKKDRQLDQLNP